MKYDHNQVCTKDNEVKVGEKYQYKEGFLVANVEVLEDRSNDDGVGFLLEIIDGPQKGRIFTCWAASGKYAYSGMWRLYDKGTYMGG